MEIYKKTRPTSSTFKFIQLFSGPFEWKISANAIGDARDTNDS